MAYRIELPPDVDPARVSVRATLYHQSIPPYYPRDRFTASNGEATRRLYYLTSNLNRAGTPMRTGRSRRRRRAPGEVVGRFVSLLLAEHPDVAGRSGQGHVLEVPAYVVVHDRP